MLVAHLLFLQHEVPRWLFRQMGVPASVMGFGVNGALWSLSIEAVFYAVLPLVAAPAFRRPRGALACALLAALAWRALAYALPSIGGALGATWPHGGVPRLFDQFPGFLGHFTFGMTGAWLYVSAHRRGGAAIARLAGPLQLAAVVLPSALALGWASRRLLEEPAIAWARARTRPGAAAGREADATGGR